MGYLCSGLLLLAALTFATPRFRDHSSSSAQLVLESLKHTEQPQAGTGRELKGKFLHITDLHPDPFYKIGASPAKDHPCHKGEGNDRSKYYGAPASECDSPFTLIDATFRWIKENIKDDIDFVIWTGDSARHDNDNDILRSDEQILDLNKYIVQKFAEVFGKPHSIDDPDPTNAFVIPIVPTLGNNDVFPHNIFMPGPNLWSMNYVEIWSQFIPQDQKHSFARGAWFWAEVIPNKLAVISLNTLYFFSSNSAVDGCNLASEPGYEHFEWLRVQLQLMRDRGLKAFLIGHVPPARTKSKRNWDESCYQKYILWQRQYRDVIVSSIYGHMNVDHFLIHDIEDLIYKIDYEGTDDESIGPDDFDTATSDVDFHIMGTSKYLNQLRAGWSVIPKPPNGIEYGSSGHIDVKSNHRDEKRKQRFYKEIGGHYGERFSLSLVSPSVVPNYYPTMRIIEYNITGLDGKKKAASMPQSLHGTDLQAHEFLKSKGNESIFTSDFETEKKKPNKKHKKKKGGHKTKPNFPVPNPPSASAPPGPAYSPQPLSLISWTQLFANLTSIHEQIDAKEDSLSKTHFENKDKAYYQYFEYTVEYTTGHDDAYRLPDLTVRNWLGLAEKIGRAAYKPSDHGIVLELPNRTALPQDQRDETQRRGNEENVEMLVQGISDLKHKGQKKKKKSGKLKANELWHEFIRRAHVYAKKEKYYRKHFN